jgi:glycosyltransferase A (GT-A) superfamily protein (DUF2064 family)
MFARSPEREALAKGLPIATAAPLFRSLLLLWIERAHDAGATPIIVSAPEDRAALIAIAPDVAWLAQRETAFGERIAAAASDVAAAGFTAIAIAAIDAPPPATLSDTFEAVEAKRVVIAAAADGGINLIAFAAPGDLRFLATIRVRQRDLVDRCRAYFPELVILPATVDVDDAASLQFYAPSLVFAMQQPKCSIRNGAKTSLPPRGPPAS